MNYTTYSSYDSNNNDNNDKSIGYADLEYNGDFANGKVHWKGLVYYLWDKNQWNSGGSYGLPDSEAYQTKYIDKTLGTDHQFTWKTSSWNNLLMGFTVENLEKESSGIANYQPTVPYTPGLDYDNQAVFIQDSMDLWDNRINLIAAARYDRFDVTTKRAETGTYTDFNEKSEDYSRISPKVGAGIKFFDEMLRLRTNIGQGFKSPTADQLSADYYQSTTATRYFGNPDLDPETSLTYDVGADLYLSALTLKLGWFHTDYEDKIVQESLMFNDVKTITYDNHGDAKIAGIEVGLEWALGQTFQLPFHASLYSNMTYNTTNEDKETGQDLLYISDYEVKSGIDVSYQGISGQLSHVLVGPQMITNYDTYLLEEKASFDYWDVTLRYRFAKHWEVKASVLNLFDEEIEWVRGYIMPERNYRLGLTYNF